MLNEFKNTITKLKKQCEVEDYFAVGFPELDEKLKYVSGGDIVVIGGRPAMGKTSLILSFINHLIDNQKKLAVFTLETSKDIFIKKLIFNRNKINLQTTLTEQNWQELLKTTEHLAKADIKVYENTNIKRFENTIRKTKPEIVFIDNIQNLINTEANHNILYKIKQIAIKYNVIVIMTSQITRGVEGRREHRPRLFDLKDYGQIEDIADVVMMIYREKYYNLDSESDIADIYIVKNEYSNMDYVNLFFNNGQFYE